MELTLNQSLETEPEPTQVANFSTLGLLNSNYKSIVKKNYEQPSSYVFKARQTIKSFQFNRTNHITAILKISVFASILLAIF